SKCTRASDNSKNPNVRCAIFDFDRRSRCTVALPKLIGTTIVRSESVYGYFGGPKHLSSSLKKRKARIRVAHWLCDLNSPECVCKNHLVILNSSCFQPVDHDLANYPLVAGCFFVHDGIARRHVLEAKSMTQFVRGGLRDVLGIAPKIIKNKRNV